MTHEARGSRNYETFVKLKENVQTINYRILRQIEILITIVRPALALVFY